MKFFINLDDKYLKPTFVYKYHKRKRRMYNIEVGDVLKEYKMIEDELDQDDSDDDRAEMGDDTMMLSANFTKNLTRGGTARQGLLSMYISAKSRKLQADEAKQMLNKVDKGNTIKLRHTSQTLKVADSSTKRKARMEQTVKINPNAYPNLFQPLTSNAKKNTNEE